MTTELIVNDKIVAKFIKLIENDKMIGVIALKEALWRAREKGLDLIMVAEGEQPVCRILDADRYRFEKSKQEREHARKQRALTIETKEIQLRPVTGENDLLTKAKKAKLFLETGDKVKITVRFRGREKTHKEEGHRIINHFIAEVGDYKIFKPLTEGESDLTIILASNVVKTEKRREKTHEVA